MKKEDNMANNDDFNLDEGNLPDKTAEIPKVTDDMTAEEGEDKKNPLVFFGREVSRKRAYAVGAGLVCAALLIGGGGYALANAGWNGGGQEVVQTADESKEKVVLSLDMEAEGWDADTSTPAIAHVVGDGTDFYHALDADGHAEIEVAKAGTYTVTFISPVNADGSIYKATGSVKVKAGKGGKASGTKVTLSKVDAGSVTKDDLTAIAGDVAEAVKKGDSTLTGTKGTETVKRFEDNIKKNPNADADAVEKETDKAEETAKKEESEAKGDETKTEGKKDKSDGSGKGTDSGKKDNGKTDGGNDGGNKGGTSGSKSDSGKKDDGGKKDETPAHKHNWVAQTKTVHHDAETHQEAYTVHHDAVTHQVWHDAVTQERYICNNCGEDITNDPWGHINNSLLNGGNCGGYHSSYVTVKQGYYETVTDQAAWDETKYKTVTDKAAYDETVTTGYKCSGCGATRSK